MSNEIWIRNAEIRQAREMEEQESNLSVYWKSFPVENERKYEALAVWDFVEDRWILP